MGGLDAADDSPLASDGEEHAACEAGGALSGDDLVERGVREEVSHRCSGVVAIDQGDKVMALGPAANSPRVSDGEHTEDLLSSTEDVE